MDGLPGFIPTQELVGWLAIKGIEDDWDRTFIISAIAALDRSYVEFMMNKREKELKRKSPKNVARGRQ